MQWLFTIDTENDLIVVCRLVNIFRRKGIKLTRLAMAAAPEGFCLVALFEVAEAEIEHIFNFIRRTEGVDHAAYYRRGSSTDSSFALVDTDSEGPEAIRWSEFLSRSRWVFASHGQAILEIPADPAVPPADMNSETPGFLPFTCVRTTRSSTGAAGGGMAGP